MIKILLILSLSLSLHTSLFAKDTEAEKIAKQNREVVEMAAKEMSSKLPQKVDDYTQLIDIEAKDESLTYTFEINTGAKSDETIIREGKERGMGVRVIRGICSSSKRFIDSGIEIVYLYRSAASKHQLFRFKANRKICVDLLGPAYE